MSNKPPRVHLAQLAECKTACDQPLGAWLGQRRFRRGRRVVILATRNTAEVTCPLCREVIGRFVVAAVHAGHTYAEVARKLPGLTRSTVSGLVWRADPARKSPFRQGHHPASLDALARVSRGASSLDAPLLALLADGRERTTGEIIARLQAPRDRVYRRLRHLMEAGGVTREFLSTGGGRCAVWREAVEA